MKEICGIIAIVCAIGAHDYNAAVCWLCAGLILG